MRFISIILISLVAFFSLCGAIAVAGERVNIHGSVRVENGNFTFIDKDSSETYSLRAYTDVALQALSKLKNKDNISGTATLVEQTLLLESVEFVGLHRLLGYWQSSDTTETLVNFKDFSRVSFHLPNSNSELSYAIAPSTGDSWRVFFAGKNSVVLGSLMVSDSVASIEFFDPNNGETTRVLDLQKVNP